MAPEYRGYWPSVVARDAKYHVTAKGAIRLIYRESRDEELHIEIGGHRQLTDLVNGVKVAHSGRVGGVFYLNEYGHVVVPVVADERLTCYFAGQYRGILEFPYDGVLYGPIPPDGLRPGDEWPGPHVGIPHILAPGGDDIRYESREQRGSAVLRIRRVWLSESVGPGYARALAHRLLQVKGWAGGRIYINEAQAFFAPVDGFGGRRYRYLGSLGVEPWFPEPNVRTDR